ncbi:MAG: transcriptional repressor LexA [Pseudomonadota bacterium]
MHYKIRYSHSGKSSLSPSQHIAMDSSVLKFSLTNRTYVLYTVTMNSNRTTKTVHQAIAAFFRENRRMPSYGEMINLLGVRSKSVVNFWVNKLINAGIIEKDNKGHLTFTKNSFGLPMAGSIQAGFPSPEEEALCDVISMDEYLITRPESSFLLRVSGDSMIGEGIMEGDLVIVEKGREPKEGDVVIAEVDGEWTMKYFRKQGKQIILEAANPKYPVIRPQQELKLGGIVSAVVRKYHH